MVAEFMECNYDLLFVQKIHSTMIYKIKWMELIFYLLCANIYMYMNNAIHKNEKEVA